MQAVTLKDAKRNLPRLMDQVLADAEPRIVVNDQGGQIVVMPLEEFNSYRETMYLLSSPANAAHLRHSIAQAERVRPLFMSWSPNETDLHSGRVGRLPVVRSERF